MTDLGLHALRISLTFAALVAAPNAPLRCALALALFFALFAASHDLVHGALGLSRRTNERVLRAAAVVMLGSGLAMRRMHMRHHAHPLGAEDIEGEGAVRSLLGAMWIAPANALRLRIAAFRAAPGRERRAQLVDALLSLLLAAFAFAWGGAALRVYVVVCVAMQLTPAVWAAHIPHHAPAWVTRAVRALAFLRSPTLLSLAFHDAHHTHPKVPCHRLAQITA